MLNVFLGHLYVFFGEVSIQIFHPLFDLFFFYIELYQLLYILKINPLLIT